MNKNVSCELCGGTDFYNEAGFYYCSECQTQSQDLREQVFEVPVEALKVTKSKAIRKKQVKKKVEQITSWECYNYAMLGLVNELVELGADGALKDVVQVIWFRYLKAIDVLQDDPQQPPKLQAFNSQQDAEIAYGRSSRKLIYKRRRSRSSSSESASESVYTNPFAINRERARKRTAMIKADYDNISSQQSASSLHNMSLSSLKSTEDSTKKKQNFLRYNKRAVQEMKKVMSKHHFLQHLKDTDNDLTCHVLSGKHFSNAYRKSSEIISRAKLYSIIYLGLLIVKDKIQLGDMIRFMYEGRISFNSMMHFFPEEFDDKKLNLKSIEKQCHIYKPSSVRMMAGKMAVFLKLQKRLPVQNLVQLCERYCEELNLPEEFQEYVITLITRGKPMMKLIPKHPIPNYEGRVMSFILFTLKLIFGVDGVTEFEFSKFAATIQSKPEMFNFADWLEHICYRSLVVQQHHFPSKFTKTKGEDYPETYVKFIENYHNHLDIKVGDDMDYQILQKLLMQLNEDNTHGCKNIEFDHTLTPFRDYLDALMKAGCIEDNNYSKKILIRDFRKTSLDFLVNSKTYINDDVHIFFSRANMDFELKPLFEHKRGCYFKREKQIVCTMVKKRDLEKNQEVTDPVDITITPLTTHESTTGDNPEGKYTHHYKPENVLWLCSAFEIENMSLLEYTNYFESLPYTFRLLIEECARAIGQPPRELLEEYVILETYMCYVFEANAKRSKKRNEAFIDRLINKYERFW